MNKVDYQNFTDEEVKELFNQYSSEQVESEISLLSLNSIKEVILSIDAKTGKKWKEMIRAAILGLNKRSQLEAAGSQLSLKQVAELLDSTLQIEDKHHWKLSPLLVGMSHDLFAQLIQSASEPHLHILQHEGVTEPVQHHLTVLAREMQRQVEKYVQDLEQTSLDLESLNIEELSISDIHTILNNISHYSPDFQNLLDRTNRALSIAWNTKRTDLIESLNQIKESCHNCFRYGIGNPRTTKTVPSGLYAKFENILFQVYGDPTNPEDFEGLREDEPATEALAKFSVWYLRDYWAMGLLPDIKDLADLELDMKLHTENERAKFRENLFTTAQANLEKVGLKTVSDLKRHYIFSKKTLKEYLENPERSLT